MRIYTIGFTGKTAREFFELLKSADARYLLDIRINNTSQLAGFTKKGNIDYFTESLTDLEYKEIPDLAPEQEMFRQYRKDRDWPAYEAMYMQLIKDRQVAQIIDQGLFQQGAVLLCSEQTPEKCHRRLAAEYLRDELSPNAEIIHL